MRNLWEKTIGRLWNAIVIYWVTLLIDTNSINHLRGALASIERWEKDEKIVQMFFERMDELVKTPEEFINLLVECESFEFREKMTKHYTQGLDSIEFLYELLDKIPFHQNILDAFFSKNPNLLSVKNRDLSVLAQIAQVTKKLNDYPYPSEDIDAEIDRIGNEVIDEAISLLTDVDEMLSFSTNFRQLSIRLELIAEYVIKKGFGSLEEIKITLAAINRAGGCGISHKDKEMLLSLRILIYNELKPFIENTASPSMDFFKFIAHSIKNGMGVAKSKQSIEIEDAMFKKFLESIGCGDNVISEILAIAHSFDDDWARNRFLLHILAEYQKDSAFKDSNLQRNLTSLCSAIKSLRCNGIYVIYEIIDFAKKYNLTIEY